MSKVVCDLSISADGCSAGRNQTEGRPFGSADESILHSWMFDTGEENRSELDAITDAKAFIMGRNMFGPVRGEWTGDWRGWWGPEPPYHAPVFVLTHHAREPLVMEGGTTFHFVTEGIEAALQRAMQAANGKDVRVGGGAATIRQYLSAGLIDEMHLAISPILLGSGEHLLEGIYMPKLGYHCTEHVPTPAATHVVLTKRS
jgi:dihydrofolate reductase